MTDNPRAFPSGAIDDKYGGMTLLDWFAGQALSNPAICTGIAPDYQLKRWFAERGGITAHEICAKQANEYARAMLGERERQP